MAMAAISFSLSSSSTPSHLNLRPFRNPTFSPFTTTLISTTNRISPLSFHHISRQHSPFFSYSSGSGGVRFSGVVNSAGLAGYGLPGDVNSGGDGGVGLPGDVKSASGGGVGFSDDVKSAGGRGGGFSGDLNSGGDGEVGLSGDVNSGGGGFSGDGNSSGGGGSGGGGGGADGGESGNRKAVLILLAEMGRSVESLPKEMVAAIEEGKLPVEIVRRYLDLEKSGFIKWLLGFAGFRDRLLADDLFLAKVAMECGVGVFTKTAAEYERRRENFFNELEVVCADVAMAIIADFMLVYLPAPTVALRQPLALNAGPIAKFFHNCPDNAFQIALGGASYSLIQRIGAIVRNGAKLFAVGTTSSLVGTAITNAAINAKKAVNKSSGDEIENVPILSTSAAYGVYMAVSSNLRYQIVAGIIEQRILEPFLHNHKLMLSALCFAVRTGNTFLGSLLWVDYARWIGVQKAHDEAHSQASTNRVG